MPRRLSRSTRSSTFSIVAACFALALAGCDGSADGSQATTPAPSATETATTGPEGHTEREGNTKPKENAEASVPSSNPNIQLSPDWIHGAREAWTIEAFNVVDVSAAYLLVNYGHRTVGAYDISSEQPEELWVRGTEDWTGGVIWGDKAVSRTGTMVDIRTGDLLEPLWDASEQKEVPVLVVVGDTLVTSDRSTMTGYGPDGTIKWSVPDLRWSRIAVNGEGYVMGFTYQPDTKEMAIGLVSPDGDITFPTPHRADGATPKDVPGWAGVIGQNSGFQPLSDGWLVTSHTMTAGPDNPNEYYYFLFRSDGTPVAVNTLDSARFMANSTAAISSEGTVLPSVKDWQNHLQNPDPWLACDGATCTINGNPLADFSYVVSATALGEGGSLLLRNASSLNDMNWNRIGVVTAEGETLWTVDTSEKSFNASRRDLILLEGVGGDSTVSGLIP
ncbi:MAG: hypothetical protein QM705_12865 [Ancrocorticia sp.]